MPLQIPAGTAHAIPEDESGTYLSGFDDLARQTQGYANERVHPEIVSDKLAASTRQFTQGIDSLGKQLDELKKAGLGSVGRDDFMKAMKGLQGELARGNTSASKAGEAHKAIGGLHDRLTRDWDRMSDGQKQLVDGIARQLAAMERIADRSTPGPGSRGGRIAKAVADKHGVGDYFDAAFARKGDRSGDDYQSSFARLARVAAGRRGLGGVFDAAFKANPSAAPRRVDAAVAARRAADAAFIGPRAPATTSTPAGQPSGKGGADVLQFIKPVSRNTSIAGSTQAIPVIPIGKGDDKMVSSLDGLNKNVIRLNDALDRDHRQRLADYEKRRQDQFDHDQSLFGKKDAPASHGPSGALAAAAEDHGKDGGGHDGGGWLSDLVHSVIEGGIGGEAAAVAAGGGGLLLGARKLLGRSKNAVKVVAKGVGGLGRFMKGRYGKWGLAAGIGAAGIYALYNLFGSASARAAETPQGAPRPEEEPAERRVRRTGDGPEDGGPERPEMGFDAAETARGAAFHGVEKMVDAVGEHFDTRREAAEHARQHAALDHAEHAPGKAAADFAAKERALMGESPAAHAARVALPSAAPVSAPAVEAGAKVAHAEAPVTPIGKASPGAGFDEQIERATGDVIKARTGARVVTSAAKAAGKGLLKVLGPLGYVLEAYSCWEQLCDLYGAHRLKQISDDTFNTEFYAIIARTLAGPAGAAIGAKLGALGGGAAGAAFAGVGAGPGALVGGLAGGIAGYFEGPQLADKLVHKLLDKARPEIDAEIDAKTQGKVTPSEPAKKDEGSEPGEDGQPKNAMGGPGGGIDFATGADTSGTGMAPASGGAHPSSAGTGGAWDGATSHSVLGVGHQGEVRHASDAFKGSGSRRAGRGVSRAEGVYTSGTGGTARPGGETSSVYGGGKVTPSDQIGPGGGSGRSQDTIDGKQGGTLGDLSSKYEGKIGTAGGDGGRAYGKYQFDYTVGGLQKCFKNNPEYASKFLGLQPGTAAFNAKWKEVAREDPRGFEAAQDRTAKAKWFDPAAAHGKEVGFHMDNRGVQEAIFSGSIQHGKINSILSTAAKTPGFADMTPQQQIQAYYAARRNYGGVQGLDAGRRAGVLKRYETEERDALKMAASNMAPGSTGPGQPPTPATTPSSPMGQGTPASGGSPPSGGSGNVQPTSPGPNVPTARSGETTDQLAHRIQNLNPRMRSAECVGLARQAAGIKEGVRDWRAGGKVSDGTMPVGTPIATFMDRRGNQSDRYDGGQGVGVHARDVIAASHGRLQAGTTHAAILAGYERDRNGRVTGIKVAQQWVGRGAHIATIKVGDRRGGEADADNYRSVNGRDGQPLGDMNPLNPKAKNYAGGRVATQSAAAQPAAVPTPQGAPAGPVAPRNVDAPQVPDASKTVRSAADKISTGWDPGMRSAYDAPTTPQVPGAKADPGMRSAYAPAPAPAADPGLRSAYDTPPATKVDQPTDVPVQAAKTSAAISSASAPASASGDSSGGGSGGGRSSGGDGGSGEGGGGFCRCTAGASGGGGGGGKQDGFGDSPMSPLLAMMNSTLFNRS